MLVDQPNHGLPGQLSHPRTIFPHSPSSQSFNLTKHPFFSLKNQYFLSFDTYFILFLHAASQRL